MITRYDFLTDPLKWSDDEVQDLIVFCETDLKKSSITESGLIFETQEEHDNRIKLNLKVIKRGIEVIEWKLAQK